MKQKILVLDDDTDILEVISYVLTESGYEITTLTGGEKIFDVIGSLHPDLVLMDVMLGSMDGRSICSELKFNPETSFIPVILISATHDLAASLRQEGAPDDFLAKPFDIDRLIRKVEQQLAA
ncbi:sigma-B regulation protein RsbU (phosphoserine phosphatase)/two-component system, OmpR family, phosphate regulon response regulator PhoB [Mucilaginibacter pineti]|uniref:Sigma-B regulation protein RsbU (Phosphoserine phosphatase)/two-component system, OmpR family, phosphate regulon response regulator PhoB n=1 Tax=Mucilaginibacter pineti TaxID=1391627 RepID=A0A1G7JWD8_9SPHI|nr:response regulator [Mucilaginibacter pineti]SDF29202.1 sigma-B regulation protein RsbU (phosphoserine phosphatase)/two-component system, OmpR family, phosphate regulon response regulator PhoB [Mucilaginibacter pineti]